MKRIIAFLLIICLASPFIPYTVSAQGARVGYIACAGNLFDTTVEPFLLKGVELYISAEDAAKFTGYTVEGVVDYTQAIEKFDSIISKYSDKFSYTVDFLCAVNSTQNKDKLRFERNGRKEILTFFEYNGEKWVSFSEAMYKLEGEVFQLEKGIYIRGVEHTKEELYEVAETTMDQAYLIEEDKGSFFGAYMYKYIMQAGVFSAESYFGNYKTEIYDQLFGELVNQKESDGYRLFKEGKSFQKAFNNIAEIELSHIETLEQNQNFYKSMLNGYVTNESIVQNLNIQDTNKVISIITDLPGEMLDLWVKNEYVDIGGLDVLSQMSVYYYMDSLVNTGSLYRNMMYYTYEEADIKRDVPEKARSVINDFMKLCESNDYKTQMSVYLKKELKTVLSDTISATIKNTAEIMGGFNVKAVELAVCIMDFFLNQIFDIHKKVDFAQKEYCLHDLQWGVLSLYNHYRESFDKAVNAKYAAMLYLRCAQLYYELYAEAYSADVEKTIKDYSDRIDKIAEFSDRDLSYERKMPEISVRKLFKNAYTEEEYVASKEGKKTTAAADSIRYFDTGAEKKYPFFIIEEGDKCGAIDENGNIIIPIEYTNLSLHIVWGSKNDEGGVYLYGQSTVDGEYYRFNHDGTVLKEYPAGWGWETGAEVYWSAPTNSPVMLCFDMETYYKEYDRDIYNDYRFSFLFGLKYCYASEEENIFIREVLAFEKEDTEYGVIRYNPIYNPNNEKYAVFNKETGGLITGFDFEDFEPFVNGIAAVKVEGGWKYINERGEYINHILYEALKTYSTNDAEMYSHINGYIVVKHNGCYGLINTYGETVLECKYQDMSQVNPSGCVWVKEGDIWKSIFVE